MCLRSIDRVTVDGVGYKVFTRRKSGKLHSRYMATRVYEGRWQTAPPGRRIGYADSSHSYPHGFHVWLELPNNPPTSARQELWKVQYQGVITSGIDNGRHVVVAKRMKPIERVDEEGRRVPVKKG